MLEAPVWDEALCRRYTAGMRKLAPYDHRSAAARIAKHLSGSRPRPTVVDVAAGPGFLALELGRLLREPELVLVDAAAPMLRIAAEEAARAGFSARTVESPAEQIALPGGSADVVTCKNLMNCVEPALRPAIARELARLLAPGGKAFIIDFDAAGSRLAATLIGTFVRVAISSEFYRDFRDAVARRLDPETLVAVLRDAGCSVGVERFGPSFLLTAERSGAARAA